MTIDQWKGYLFTEQLFKAADNQLWKVESNEDNYYSAAQLQDTFIEGARWRLNSELVREMHDMLLIAKVCFENFTEQKVIVEEINKTLHKLTEARGEK